MIRHQLGRRNLTPDQQSYLRGKQCELEKRQGQRTDVTSRQSGEKFIAEALAQHHKVSSRTIERDAAFAAAVDSVVASPTWWCAANCIDGEIIMIRHQLGRRNLTPDQQSYLRGKQYELRKQQGKRTGLTSPHCEEKLTTAEKLAEHHKVSRATIERDAAYAASIDTVADAVGGDAAQGDNEDTACPPAP